jgi:hypothetical protein
VEFDCIDLHSTRKWFSARGRLYLCRIEIVEKCSLYILKNPFLWVEHFVLNNMFFSIVTEISPYSP